MRQFAGGRQMQTGLGTQGRVALELENMWRLGRAKSLVGGLYLFFKGLVRFIYTRQRLECAWREREGGMNSLSGGSL